MFLLVCVILFTGEVSVSVPERSLCPGGLCQGDLPCGKERAVRILLECILVYCVFLKFDVAYQARQFEKKNAAVKKSGMSAGRCLLNPCFLWIQLNEC